MRKGQERSPLNFRKGHPSYFMTKLWDLSSKHYFAMLGNKRWNIELKMARKSRFVLRQIFTCITRKATPYMFRYELLDVHDRWTCIHPGDRGGNGRHGHPEFIVDVYKGC